MQCHTRTKPFWKIVRRNRGRLEPVMSRLVVLEEIGTRYNPQNKILVGLQKTAK